MRAQPALREPARRVLGGPRLAGLTAADARRFRTGRSCLDFCHTGGGGPLAKFELLRDGPSLADWLGVVLNLEGIDATDDDVAQARELRRAIWSAAHALIAHDPVTDEQRQAINDAATREPIVPFLHADGTVSAKQPVTISQVLSRWRVMRSTCSAARWRHASESARQVTAGCCSSINPALGPAAGVPCSAVAILRRSAAIGPLQAAPSRQGGLTWRPSPVVRWFHAS